MRKAFLLVGTCTALATLLSVMIATQTWAAPQAAQQWGPNDDNRPKPPIITPGTASTQEQAGKPPSDAIVLFNGKDLSNWENVHMVNNEPKDPGPAKWAVKDGYFEVVPHTGMLRTKAAYGDCQLHVEFAEPVPPVGTGQGRGNSGVFLQGLYEIQVLDSYDNPTYADGGVGGVYGQYPPLVTAARKPGEWQMYDIFFHGPRFDANGKLLRKATVTVVLNGVLIQDHVEIMGPTAHHARPPYTPTPEKMPLMLQDHGNPVRFRNLWIRELKEGE
jgi:hypothetical protein